LRRFFKRKQIKYSRIVLIFKEMKKLVLFFAMATVVAFSACSNKTQETTTPADTTTTAPAPAAPADTTTAPAETPAQ
jgi:hypothetical protein